MEPEKAYAPDTYNKDSDNFTDSHPLKQNPLYKTPRTGKSQAELICKKCLKRKEIYPKTQVSCILKSNQAIHEEYQKLSTYLNSNEIKCRNDKYDSNFWAIKKLKKRGLTKAGNQRYQCLVWN